MLALRFFARVCDEIGLDSSARRATADRAELAAGPFAIWPALRLLPDEGVLGRLDRHLCGFSGKLLERVSLSS